MNTAVDLFSGLGGWSTGASMAGIKVLWAANHWPDAVRWHTANHPDTEHVCQDLHQADWSRVPGHDLLLASPCCQGHSRARGRDSGKPHHDTSRSTAWAVVSAAEYHRPPVVLLENVPEFMNWRLYHAWTLAMESLGYAMAPHIIDCADLGVPQNRVRLFLVGTRSKTPLFLNLPKGDHIPARNFLEMENGRWTPVEKPSRAKATGERIRAGRKQHGENFLISYYGNSRGGRSLNRPIGTITTRDRWAIVRGDRMRMLTAGENLLAMGFSPGIKVPENHRLAVHLAGNAVPPVAAKEIIRAVRAQA